MAPPGLSLSVMLSLVRTLPTCDMVPDQVFSQPPGKAGLALPAASAEWPGTHSTSSSPDDTAFSQPAGPATPCSLGRGAAPSGTVLPKKTIQRTDGSPREHCPALASRPLSATNDTSHGCNFCSYCVSFPKTRNSSRLRGPLSQTRERNYLLPPQSTHTSHSLLTLAACLGVRAHTRVHAHILVQPSHAHPRTHVQTHSCTHTHTHSHALLTWKPFSGRTLELFRSDR